MNTQLNSYEEKQLAVISEWNNREPSVVSQKLGAVMTPITNAITKVIPKKAILGAIQGANNLAEFLTDHQDILRDGNVSDIKELQSKDLELSDRLASTVANWAMGIAGVEGAATGATGLPGMAADIPALITLSLRSIHKIGLCYGYVADTQEEKEFVLQVMSATGANTMAEKNAALLAMKRLNVTILKNSWKTLAEQAAAKQVSDAAMVMLARNLAKQLGINLTKRKALQAIPIIGAAVGATMNVAFIHDVCEAAQIKYKERWLNSKQNCL